MSRAPALLGTQAMLDLGQPQSALVTFVVDSTGAVMPRSFRVIRATHPGWAATLQNAIPRWHFRPARLHGRAVPQLVEMPLEWHVGS